MLFLMFHREVKNLIVIEVYYYILEFDFDQALN
jgi:hypothetical protein